MRLLVYEWNSLTHPYIYAALNEMGVDYDIVHSPTARVSMEQEVLEGFIASLEEHIFKEGYDALFSINFMDFLAQVCHQCGILYICWSYDSPSLAGNPESHFYDTNRIFLFDSYEVERHKKRKVKNIWHLNLAVDVRRMNQFTITPMDRLRFQSDISFVGQLYRTEIAEALASLNEYKAAYVDALINIQMNSNDCNLMRELIVPDFAQFLRNPDFERHVINSPRNKGDEGGEYNAGMLAYFLQRAATSRERILLLSMLSKKHGVKFFSTDRHEALGNVIHAGPVDYMTEMPKVFALSKINLNVTLRSIESAIPQRCLDIMACHGFLLTNRQEDLFVELEDGKDIVVYEDIGDALEKTDFYLSHDSIREEIAASGYRKMRDVCNYPNRLKKIFELSGLDWK